MVGFCALHAMKNVCQQKIDTNKVVKHLFYCGSVLEWSCENSEWLQQSAFLKSWQIFEKNL